MSPYTQDILSNDLQRIVSHYEKHSTKKETFSKKEHNYLKISIKTAFYGIRICRSVQAFRIRILIYGTTNSIGLRTRQFS